MAGHRAKAPTTPSSSLFTAISPLFLLCTRVVNASSSKLGQGHAYGPKDWCNMHLHQILAGDWRLFNSTHKAST
ncbi:hypothetical protein GLYMA_04G089132v4 [Glycine max]|nr:hypothetical protein GLYMA_04G089132v4 [Glycine max]KAH1110519.1 hypothetical protein GYH30_009385 [Glycine max]